MSQPSKEEVDRYRLIAKRLTAARRNSGLNQQQVAEKVGQKGMTQVSLWEKGDRQPSLMQLIKMALIYKVPLDFLTGITDDLLGDSEENAQGFMTNMIVNAMNTNFMAWAQATAESTSALIKSNNQDRADIIQIGKLTHDVRRAYARMKELNPDFEDEVPGAATVEAALKRVTDLADSSSGRADALIRQVTQIERELKVADGEMQRRLNAEVPVNVSQMLLGLQEAG